jgi:hypothetical protein
VGGGAAGVAFVEDALPLVDGEVPRPSRPSARRGSPGPRTVADLRRTRSGVRFRDLAVDMVYQNPLEDIKADAGSPASPIARRRRERSRVSGEFAHRRCPSDRRPELAGLFTPAEHRLLRRCARPALGARTRRTRPVGRSTEFGPGRERLLIQPQVGSRGSGLLLGLEAGPARWEARITRALREPGRWVVQLRRPGTCRPMVYLRNGRAHTGLCYFSLGLFYAPGALGLHCRVSREPVVNVARQGAVACAFLVGR